MRFDPRQNNPVGILLLLVTIGGLFGAIAMGQMVARSEFIKIGAFAAAGIGLAICLAMGKKIWMLIPLFWLLTGKIQVLPLPATVRDMSVLAAFGIFAAMAAFKRLPKMSVPNYYDLFLYVNLAYLVSVYMRNPVGTRALGSEMVGGRPYIDVIIAVLAYWVLQHVHLTTREVRIMPILMSIGSAFVAGLGILTQRIPALVPIIAPFYSGIEISSYMAQFKGGPDNNYRIVPLMEYGQTVSLALISFCKPISLLLPVRPLRSLIFYSCIVAILLSGFRSAIVYFAAMTLLSSYFYSGMKDVVKFGVLGLLGIAMIILAYSSGMEIHPAAQRALSFIPVGWDAQVIEDAETSSSWRFEMWKIALESDKYIKNKLLGDGFGFSAYELQIQVQAAFGGQGYMNANETEAQLVTGAYHSGPISAIRYVGVVGLFLFTIFLVTLATYAWGLINQAKGTYIFPMALFVGIPAIYKPFEYYFVFGGFDGDLPKAIFSLAMLNLTARALKSAKAGEFAATPTLSLSDLTSRPSSPV